VRLFVAAWPPDAVLAKLRALPRPALAGLRWTTEEQWHVTLAFAGEIAPDRVQALADDLAGAVGRADTATVELGPRAIRLGPSVLCLPAVGLEAAAAAARPAVEAVRTTGPSRPFRGHLTLARGRGGRPLPRGLNPADVTLSCRFTIDELSLVASELDRGGARYRTVARLTLGRVP
jgi:2'-5' RNA ligase